jgi:signal transduction histidine kinase/ligand-binding sensor domain-containing protein
MKGRRDVNFDFVIAGFVATILSCLRLTASDANNSSDIFVNIRSPGFGGFQEYSVHQWTSANGLPASLIQCLLQTRDGYLWVGTRNGLSRFNGNEFKTLRGINCIRLAEASDGVLWIGGLDGVRSWDGRRLKRYSVEKVAPAKGVEEVYSLYPRSLGGVWVAWVGGLGLITNESPALLNSADLFRPSAVDICEANGELWMGGRLGLRLIDGLGPTANARTVFSDQYTHALLRDNAGTLWFSGVGGVLHHLREGKISDFHPDESIFNGEILSLAQDRREQIWVGTTTGLRRLGDDSLLHPVGLNGQINCLSGDREGNLWVGTEQDGLFCLRRKPIATWTKSDGLIDDNVWTITEASDSTIWIGTAGGVSHLTVNGWQNYGPKEGLANPWIHSLYIDRAGSVWAGSHIEGGLLRFENGRFLPVPGDLGAGSDISSITQDTSGTLWALSYGFLCRYSSNQPTLTTIAQIDHPITGLFSDREGRLWIGGTKLHYYFNERLVDYVPVGSVHDLHAVVHEDTESTLWLVSASAGLLRLKDDRITAINAQHGLPTDLALSFQEDAFGYFWVNTHEGIYRISKQELNDVADGKRSFVNTAIYGLEDGMISSEGNGGTFPNSCKTRDGRIWFPTARGAVVVDPKFASLDALPPPIHIESMQASGRLFFENFLPQGTNNTVSSPFSLGREIQLPAGRAESILIFFSANALLRSENVRFRYRLSGNAGWIDLKNQPTVLLKDLSPGHYKFEVTGCNSHGVWSPEPSQLAFYIAPFFYQTTTFYALCAATVLAAGYGFHFRRLKHHKQIQLLEQKASLERERARIARDMHDAIGANLAKIQLISQTISHSDSVLREKLAKITESARTAARDMHEIVWLLKTGSHSLKELVEFLTSYTAEFLDDAGIALSEALPASFPEVELPVETCHNLFLAFKEALTNACKYSGAPEIVFRCSVQKGEVLLEIQDNGRGFSFGDGNPPNAYGCGIENMRERLRSIGGEFEVKSNPNEGTCISLRIAY